jgi:hypothetical protein
MSEIWWSIEVLDGGFSADRLPREPAPILVARLNDVA